MKAFRFPLIHSMRRHAGALSALAVAATLMALPELALAQLSDKPVRMVNEIAAMLRLMGLGVFTAAVLWGSYKMLFAGAQFRDISNIFWAAVLAGSVAAIATWAMAA